MGGSWAIARAASKQLYVSFGKENFSEKVLGFQDSSVVSAIWREDKEYVHCPGNEWETSWCFPMPEICQHNGIRDRNTNELLLDDVSRRIVSRSLSLSTCRRLTAALWKGVMVRLFGEHLISPYYWNVCNSAEMNSESSLSFWVHTVSWSVEHDALQLKPQQISGVMGPGCNANGRLFSRTLSLMPLNNWFYLETRGVSGIREQEQMKKICQKNTYILFFQIASYS